MDRFAPNGPAANALKARVASLIARQPSGSKPAIGLIRLIEYSITCAIGAVIGLLFWVGLGPLPEPPAAPATPPQAARPVIAASAVNPFKNGVAPAALDVAELVNGPDLEETSLDLALHGTWIDDTGGTAIIKTPDDKQGRYRPGDTVWESVTLEQVFRDQVIIDRDGTLESLRLIGRQPSAADRSEGDEASDTKAAGEVFASLGSFISVAPQTDNVGGVNLVLEPPADDDHAYTSFLASGLRPGDVLVGIDGEPVGRDIGADIEYLQKASGRNKITVNVDRGGVVTPIEIDLKGLATNGG
jgi:hypothetical protein